MNAAPAVEDGQTVDVVQPPPTAAAVVGPVQVLEVTPARTVLVEAVQAGPQGPEGPQGVGVPGPVGGYLHQQATPAGTWTWPHQVGRLPNLATYVDGARVYPDEYADDTTATLVFAQPTAGYTVAT